MFNGNIKPEDLEITTRYVATSYAKPNESEIINLKNSQSLEKDCKPKSIRSMLPRQLAETPKERPFAKTGARGRSREFYIGNNQYEKEMERIFGCHWLPIEHVSRLKEQGAFVTLKFDNIHILVMRGEKGIQAYHNYCTHRGCCLVEEASGKRDKYVCKYHCWLFNSDGELDAWNGTFLDSSFSPEASSLRQIPTEIRYGMVFICFSQTPPDLDEALGDFPKFANLYDLENAKCVDTRDYSVDCNWKLVMHNINESLHFPATHQYVHRVADYDDAGIYDVKGDLVCSFNRIRKGFNSVSLTGNTSRPTHEGVPEEDKDIVVWVTILPNLMFGFSADYILMQWAWPVSPSACLVRNHWLFYKNQISKPDFSCDDVIDLWLKTNDEDWEICERTQRGIESRYWEPGFLSLDEETTAKIDQWVATQTE